MPGVAFGMGFERERVEGRWGPLGETRMTGRLANLSWLDLNPRAHPCPMSAILSGTGLGPP